MIHINNLTLRFVDQPVFRNLNLEIERGAKVAIKGGSGRGKSTLFKLLMGFLRPTEGEIYIGETKLDSRSVARLRALIAWLPQNVPGRGTAEEFINTPYQYRRNRNRTPGPDLLRENLAELGLERSLLKKDLEQLSGGQRQRLALVSLLLLERPLLLLDEPTSALDQENARRVTDRIFADPELTVLAISHSPEIWERSDRLMDLDVLPS